MLLIKAICREHAAALRSSLWPVWLPGEWGAGGGPAASSAAAAVTVRGDTGWWLGVHMGTAAPRLLWKHQVPLIVPKVCMQSGTSTTVSLSPCGSTLLVRHNFVDRGSTNVLFRQSI